MHVCLFHPISHTHTHARTDPEGAVSLVVIEKREDALPLEKFVTGFGMCLRGSPRHFVCVALIDVVGVRSVSARQRQPRHPARRMGAT